MPRPKHYNDDLLAGRSIYSGGNRVRILRPEGMDSWIVHLTVAGVGRVRCGDHERDDVPGDVVLFAAGAVHDYGPAPDSDCWEHVWVNFHPRPEWFDRLAWPQVAPGIAWLHLAGHPLLPRINTTFERAIARYQEGGRFASAQAMNAVEEILLWCEQAGGEESRHDPRVQRAIEWMRAHLTERITVSDVARIAGCSSSRLAHLFAAAIGQPPMRFLEGLRLERACDLLRMSALPIAEIGRQVGCEDPTWFGRIFARRFGCSPRRFRRERTGDARWLRT